MASRHFSLQMGEVADLLDLMLGFEEQNKVKLEISLSVGRTQQSAEMWVKGSLFTPESAPGGVQLFSSVSVKCLDTGLKNLRDVVTHVLYALDFRLALDEFDAVEKKKA